MERIRRISARERVLHRTMVFAMVFVMLIISALGETGVFAKEIDYKNESAKQSCDAVVRKNPPDGYTSVLADQDTSVFRGGNSLTKWTTSWYGGARLDNDPNDFAKPLPYGNTYVDTSKLIWTNPDGFIIDIQDDRFKWVSKTSLTDAAGHTSINDPTDHDKGFIGDDGIYYVGELQSYLPNVTDAASDNGYTNVIEPQNGAPYLYSITYLNAVTLPDGTKGNLQLTMEKMKIESSFTTNAANPYVTAGGDTYDKAIIRAQGPNELSVSTNITDSDGNYLNPRDYVAITAEEATQIMTDVNEHLPTGEKFGSGWNTEKTTRHAVGGLYDLGIKVTDMDGNPVKGTLSYASHDLDMTSAQGLWGHPVKNADGTYNTDFGEGMRILSGSLSYALTPKYEHDNNRDGGQPTIQEYGWLERGPFEPADKDSPLAITRDTTGAGTGPADGVRFSTTAITNLRDENGTFEKAVFNNNAISTPPNYQAASGTIKNASLEDEPFSNNMKKLIWGMMKRDNFANAPARWQDLTMTLAYEYLGDASWRTERNDDNELSFDTGFAVLLDAAGSKLQWSCSRISGASVSTKLFDTSIYTYVETTHGTGGGIYIESYDIGSNCDPLRTEGTVTTGVGNDVTATVVPEDGYRVKRILVGDPSLTDPVEYDIENITFTEGKYEDAANGVLIEQNSDGTYDVTLSDVHNPRHVHADFSADYYFYKVWKGNAEPTSLNMTATPYAFVFKEVTIAGTKYKINGNDYSAGGNTYTMEDGILVIGSGTDVKSYTLRGNKLVHYDRSDPDNPVIDEEYEIKLDFKKAGGPVEFTVAKDDADDDSEKHVIKDTDSDENIVWKIRYPSDGYTTTAGQNWPALQTETDPESHAVNHVERIYWFVTEEAMGWANVEYDNATAEAPGKITEADGRGESYHKGSSGDRSVWAEASIKDYAQAEEVIEDATDNARAYMSVFSNHDDAITEHNSWGGEIVNAEALIVKAEKSWDDFNDRYEDREEIWIHIDSIVGSTTIKDVLPPQKIMPGDSGADLTKTWGDRTVYTAADGSSIVGNVKDLPSATSGGDQINYTRQSDGSFKGSDDTVWWVNELAKRDKDGNEIKYAIRETDKNGTDINKTDVDELLKGYTTKIDEWEDFAKSTTEVDGTPIDTYTGEIENKLYRKDLSITKKWIGPAPEDVTLTLMYDIGEGETEVPGVDPVSVSKSDFTAAGISTKAYEFKNVPKYIKTKKATFTIKETPDGGDDWSGTLTSGSYDSGSFEVTNTNDETIEIPVSKVWDDADDQDGIRPSSITYDLNANGSKVASEEVSVGADGKADFTFTEDDQGADLRKYDAVSGAEINYSITEEDIPVPDGHATGYTSSVSGDKTNGFVVTNTHIPETVKILLEKHWVDDGADTRPDSITVLVKADGTEIADSPVTLTAANGWEWTSADLPKYKNGVEIEYTAEEEDVEDYIHDDADNKTEKINNVVSITVKNTSLVEVQGNKEWVGDDSKYGVRPESLDIQLMQTVEGVTSEVSGAVVTTSDADNWSYSFGKQPAYTDDEYKITYSVNEVEVPSAYTQSTDGMNIVNTLVDPPVGEDSETYGKKGDPQYQDVKEMFEKGTGEIEKYELIDPETGEPAEGPVPAYDEDGNEVGKYTIDEDGKITFTPNPDFIGTPTPAIVRATDENGLWAEAKYTPHVKDTSRTVKRTITWVYNDKNKTPVQEELVQTATFIGEVDPKTGEIISWGDPQTMEDPGNPDVKGWTPDIKVPEWTGTPDNPPEDVEVVYRPEPPKGTPKKTKDYKNKKQSATIEFEVSTPTTPDGSKNKIEKMLLVDPVTGKEAKTVKVKGEGTYTIDKNGKISFTPEKDYVGKTSGIKIVGYDSNGYKAETTYTPTVINKYTVTYRDPATGKKYKGPVSITEGDPECEAPADPTRKGYKFVGWDRIVKYDSRGNIEAIVYEAKWEKTGGSGSGGYSVRTGDDSMMLIWSLMLALAASSMTGFVIARRKRKA